MNIADQAEAYLRIRGDDQSTEDTRVRDRAVFDDLAAAKAAAVPPTEEYLAAKAALRKRKNPDGDGQ